MLKAEFKKDMGRELGDPVKPPVTTADFLPVVARDIYKQCRSRLEQRRLTPDTWALVKESNLPQYPPKNE
jgi:hypothetical protein